MTFHESFVLLVQPSLSEAEHAVREAISCHKILLVVGRCLVQYAGRAKSKLEAGERIIIIKSDGSVLIHRSTGYEPVNWMPGGKVVIHVQSKEKVLEIHAARQRPSESVKVSLDTIQLVTALSLLDDGKFSLHASEEDMQKAVLFKPELLEEGLKIISWEKKVEPGFIDVYGTDKSGRLVVVEIKRKTAGKEAVLQLAKYIEAIRRKADREVRGVLASPGIAKDVQRLLVTSGLEFRQLDPKKCADTLHRAETRKLAEYFSRKPE